MPTHVSTLGYPVSKAFCPCQSERACLWHARLALAIALSNYIDNCELCICMYI